MYPQRELNRLAAYKSAVRRDITVRRTQCAVAATRAAQPLALIDRTVAFLRGLSPVAMTAALPLGFVVARRFFPRLKMFNALVRWGPLAFGALRGVRSFLSPARSGTPAPRP